MKELAKLENEVYEEPKPRGRSFFKWAIIALILILAASLLLLAYVLFFQDGDSGPIFPETDSPTKAPVPAPVPLPTSNPTGGPTDSPTIFPTVSPTVSPTISPTSCPTTELGVEVRGPGDEVSLIFTGCPNQANFDAFTAAARKWSEIIIENKIQDTFVNISNVNDPCPFLAPFPVDIETTDHLIIIAETTDIDGPGGVLASAGACLVDEGFFPVFGGMRFDNADALFLEENEIIEDVVLHEMGHVLGIARIFFQLVQQNGGFAGPDPENDLIVDPVFDEDGSVNYGRSPKFIGETTTAIFESLGGENASAGVPLEDGFDGDFDSPLFDFNVNSGRGSIDSHIDKNVFDTELMTFAISSRTPPMSNVTIGILADLGYSVNFTLADDYALPTSAPTVPTVGDEEAPLIKPKYVADLSHDEVEGLVIRTVEQFRRDMEKTYPK